MPRAEADEKVLLVMWLLLVQGSVLLSLIDVAVCRLPTRLVYALGIVVAISTSAAALIAREPKLLLGALSGASALGGFYLLIAVLLPSQIGLGDVRLAIVLGAALGTSGWHAVLQGWMLAYVLAFPFALISHCRAPRAASTRIPFGPFLASGAILAAIITAKY